MNDRPPSQSPNEHDILIENLQSANALLQSQLVEANQAAEEKDAELLLLKTVTDGLSDQKDIQAIYELVGDRAREIFDDVDLGIAIFNKEADLVRVPYLVERGVRLEVAPISLGDNGFLAHVLQSRKPLLINENMELEGTKYGSQRVAGEIPKSALYVPIFSGEDVKGVIMLQDMEREHAFDKSDVRLLSTLASSIRIALKNVHLFDQTQRLLLETEKRNAEMHQLLEETQQRNAELAVINSVQQGLAAQIDMQGIYDLVGDKVREILDTQTVMITIYDHEQGAVRTPYLYEKGERFFLPDRPLSEHSRYQKSPKDSTLFNTA